MDKKIQIKTLLKEIGKPYEQLNKDGTYQGCFYPMQVLYPEVRKYKLRYKTKEKIAEFALEKIKKYFFEIQPSELQTGDLIAAKLKTGLHIAVYFEYGKVIHIFKENTLQIGRLKMFKNFQAFRRK